jgi:hypothetical protein
MNADGRTSVAQRVTNGVPITDTPTVCLVHHRGRPVGAYVVDAGSVRFVPVVDLNRLVLGGLGCAAATAVALAVAVGRRRVGIGSVTMGPGGWISLKNATAAGLRPARARPWWARLLRAHRLVVEHQ